MRSSAAAARRGAWRRRHGSLSPLSAPSILVPEQVEEPEHDAEHPDRSDPADRGRVAAVLITDLERGVPHVDGPRVRRPPTIESACEDVLVDERERGTEAEHDEHEQDRTQ